VFAPSFAKAFDNWMIGLLLWMSPWAGVVMADFFIKRRGHIDVANYTVRPRRAPMATSTGQGSRRSSSA
jgi:purine-cytosine permease-like protein